MSHLWLAPCSEEQTGKRAARVSYKLVRSFDSLPRLRAKILPPGPLAGPRDSKGGGPTPSGGRTAGRIARISPGQTLARSTSKGNLFPRLPCLRLGLVCRTPHPAKGVCQICVTRPCHATDGKTFTAVATSLMAMGSRGFAVIQDCNSREQNHLRKFIGVQPRFRAIGCSD
jgi:hypothetical protein